MPLKPILRNDASVYNLLTDGGLVWRDGKRYLNDADSGVTMGGANGTIDARVAFKDYYDVHKAAGKTDDQFMQQTFLDAQAGQAVWLGHAGSATDPCQSRSDVTIPQGAFMQSKPMGCAFNIIRGHNASEFWTNGNNLDKWGGTKAQGGTQLIIDHARWSGTQSDNQIQGTTWGMEGGNSYQENFFLDRLFLDGAKRGYAHDPNKQIGAIGMYDSGSASKFGVLQLKRHEGPALKLARGTPLYAERLVIMYSNTAAVDLIGDGIFDVQNLEVDSSASVFRIRSGFGRAAGAALRCGFLKIEDGADGISSQRPVHTSLAIVDMIEPGWVDLMFDVIAGSSKNFNADLMRLNCPISNNTSSVRVNLLREFGAIHCLVHDVANKKAWNTDHGTNYGASFQTKVKSLSWHNWNGGELFTGQGEFQPVPVSRPNSWRMNSQDQDPMTGNIPAFNDLAGTPKYTFIPEGGTVTPPLPSINGFAATNADAAGSVTLAWNCSNTDSVSITGVGSGLPFSGNAKVTITSTTSFTLTAKNANGTATSTVTVTLNTGGTAKWTSPWANPLTIVPTTSYPVNVPGVTKVEIKALKATALSWGRILGVGGTSGGLQIANNGEWWWNNTRMSPQPPKVVLNATADYAITIPAMDIKCIFQTSDGQGGAQVGQVGTITLR